MKRIFSILCVLAVAGLVSGCLHEEVPQPCSFSVEDLAFSGDCSVDLDGVLGGLRDRLDD